MARSTTVEAAVARLKAARTLQSVLPPPVAAGTDLSGDHPFFDLLPAAREAAREALERGETHYADVPGITELRDAVAQALTARGVTADPKDGVIIAAGEQEARFIAIQTLAHAGFRLILPEVVHPGASKAASLGRVAVERVPVDPSTLMPDLDAVRRMLTSGPAAVYLESPSRLSGKIIDRPIVEALSKDLARTESIAVWDAALAQWLPDGTDYAMIGALPGMADRTITIGSLWAGAGVDGWLTAYLAGPPGLFAQARSLKQIIAICTTAPAQWGVLGALSATEGAHRARRDALEAHRRKAAGEFPSGVLPGEAAAILAVRPPAPVDVSTLPARPMDGAVFGAPGVLRFAVTPSGEVVGALRALAAQAPRRAKR